jgi:hypothetical protein
LCKEIGKKPRRTPSLEELLLRSKMCKEIGKKPRRTPSLEEASLVATIAQCKIVAA